MFSFSKKVVLIFFTLLFVTQIKAQDFQGQAYYFSKTTMDMSRWDRGGKMSEAQKKQMEARMKPWLEKTYILTFNKVESIFKEDEKLEGGPGGRAPSMWGSSFSAGPQYKNIKTQQFLQDQEFFGRQFLITDPLKKLDWKMGTETKQIGQYVCMKATVTKTVDEMDWRSMRRRKSSKETTKDSTATKAITDDIETPKTIEVTAWYTPQIPVSQGPGEYWGLPGLILEVNADKTTILCSRIVINPNEKEEIIAPSKGIEISRVDYNATVKQKMQEMREMYRGRRGKQRY